MAKKLMMVLCSITLMLTMFFVIRQDVKAEMQYKSADGRFEYTIKVDGSISITDYYGTDGNVVIPETIDGYTVSEIGDYTFYEYFGPHILETIELPNTVISIGEEAFSYCENLKTIIWPDSLQSIGNYAFEGCISLEKVTLPDTISDIGDEVFAYCSSLEEINIPQAMTYIPSTMFYDCRNLTKVTIPETVTRIEFQAFAYCTSLEEIHLPDTVTYLDDSVFVGCSNLARLNIPDSVTYMGNSFISGCDKLTEIHLPGSLESMTIYMFAHSAIEEITIPEKFTTLPKGLFQDCDNLKTVHLPDTLKEINHYAFAFCDNLESIEIPEGVTELKSTVFAVCPRLKSVKLPDTLIKINGGAFDWCTGLETITLPASVKEINENPFTGCTALKDIKVSGENPFFSSQDGVLFNQKEKKLVTYPFGKTNNVYKVPDGTASIGNGAFSFATGALNTVELPASVEWIEALAFNAGEGAYVGELEYGGESSITDLKVYNPDCHIFDDEDNTEESISYYYGEYTIFEDITIYGYLNSTAQKYAQKYNRKFVSLGSQPSTQQPSNNGNTVTVDKGNGISSGTGQKVSAPATGTILNDSKTKAIYTVTTSGASVAYKAPANKKVKKVTIPSNVNINGITYKVTSVAPNAFKKCKKLKKVTIGAGVTEIGKNAFAGCKNLKNVIVKSKSLKKVGKNAFKGINKAAKIKVPKKQLKKYQKLFKKAKVAKSVKITK